GGFAATLAVLTAWGSRRAAWGVRTLSPGWRTWSRRPPVTVDDTRRDLDLSSSRRVHVVGVGGAGMSAIATVLARMGHHVTGSDLKESRGLERLRLLGVRADVGHRAENVPADTDAVVVSTAIPDTHVDVRPAVDPPLPVLRRADPLRAHP